MPNSKGGRKLLQGTVFFLKKFVVYPETNELGLSIIGYLKVSRKTIIITRDNTS